MTIERLLEAAKRLQDKLHPLIWIRMDVSERHVLDKSGYLMKDRSGHLMVSNAAGVGNANGTAVGTADIDINGIVLSIKYDDGAPWWAVKPFTDAMEGK